MDIEQSQSGLKYVFFNLQGIFEFELENVDAEDMTSGHMMIGKSKDLDKAFR